MDESCPACGKSNPAGSQFCSSCGVFLRWDDQTGASADAKGAEPTNPQVPTTTPDALAQVPDGQTAGAKPDAKAEQPTSQPPTVKMPAANPENHAGAGTSPLGTDSDPTDQMACPACGRANDPDRRFCVRCGAALYPIAPAPQSGVPPPTASPPTAPPPTVLQRGRLLLIVAGVLVAVGLVALGGWQLFDHTKKGLSSGTGQSSATTGSPPTGSSSPTQVLIPADARACSVKGHSDFATAYSGNDKTTCAFTGAVRDAYLLRFPKGGSGDMRVTSPVTGNTYTMTCTHARRVKCQGATDAVIYLGPWVRIATAPAKPGRSPATRQVTPRNTSTPATPTEVSSTLAPPTDSPPPTSAPGPEMPST